LRVRPPFLQAGSSDEILGLCPQFVGNGTHGGALIAEHVSICAERLMPLTSA
jgi:hypothetical protein